MDTRLPIRILRNNVGKEVCKQIRLSGEQPGIEVAALNVQIAHVHLPVKAPPRLSVSHVIGHSKGKTAFRLFSNFPACGRHFWGNRFWARGYCVDIAGINEEMRRKYVKYQEKHEAEESQLPLKEGRREGSQSLN